VAGCLVLFIAREDDPSKIGDFIIVSMYRRQELGELGGPVLDYGSWAQHQDAELV
jgi:hypothetical protein